MKRPLVSLSVLALLGVGIVASSGTGGATSPDTTESATSAPTGSTAATSADDASMAESTPPADAFNDADIAFAQGMIPHHEQAIDMADLALDPDSEASPEVVDLATRIQAAQGPEIELMTGWLEAWGEPIAPITSEGSDMASTEPTQSSDMDMSGTTDMDMDMSATTDMDMSDTTDTMDMTDTTDTMDMTDTTDTMDMTDTTDMVGMMSATDMAALDELTGAEFDEMWLSMMIEHHEGAIAMSETEQADGLDSAAIDLAGQIIEAQQAEIDAMNDLLGGGLATTDPPSTTG